MHGLSNWNPQPLVKPLVHEPIDKQYMRQRLYEQLHNATNGFTVNIFKVVGFEAKQEDADGDVDTAIGMAGVASRRASTINLQQPPIRRQSGQNQR